ncbi:hypothetical protein D3C86_1791840 [compost metagenome]
MNALVKAYEDLSADDSKYLDEIKKDGAISDKFLKELEKLMDDNSFHNLDTDWKTEEEFNEKSRRANFIWQECHKLSGRMSKFERLNHSVVFDVLYSDIEEILQKSLGQYKFKKGDLHEEDKDRYKTHGRKVQDKYDNRPQ